MTKITIKNCPYCGSTNIGKGYQTGYAGVCSFNGMFKRSILYHVICTDCGSVIHSYVDKPQFFIRKKR